MKITRKSSLKKPRRPPSSRRGGTAVRQGLKRGMMPIHLRTRTRRRGNRFSVFRERRRETLLYDTKGIHLSICRANAEFSRESKLPISAVRAHRSDSCQYIFLRVLADFSNARAFNQVIVSGREEGLRFRCH